MKLLTKLLVLSAFVLAMMIPLAGCSSDSGTIEGTLVGATNETIVVDTGSGVEEFTTIEETVYNLGDETEITAGDKLSVDYHKDGDSMVADTVTVLEAVKHELTMEGELSDLEDDTFVVSSDGLSAVFTYDSETQVTGELNEGDEVKVTYEGDLSEDPHAIAVEVLKEEEDDPHYEAHGNVADVSDTSVLLSIDSADAYRFVINGDTEINSPDNKIEVGDRAEITFTGDIDQDPVATKIIVHHQAKKDQSVINGTLDKAEGTFMELNTGKNTYKILVDDKTKFTGHKYKAGVKATVTYTGKLGEDPLAVKVYCDKEKAKPTEPTTAAPDPTTKPSEPTTNSKETSTKATETTATQTETKTTESPTPTPVIITAQGTLETWDGEKFTCSVTIEGEEEPIELTTENATIACGYFPQVGDVVQVMYDKDKMELVDLQLISRPDPDPETPPNRNEGGGGGDSTPVTEATTQSTTQETTTEATTTKETTTAPTTTEATTTTQAAEDNDSEGED